MSSDDHMTYVRTDFRTFFVNLAPGFAFFKEILTGFFTCTVSCFMHFRKQLKDAHIKSTT